MKRLVEFEIDGFGYLKSEVSYDRIDFLNQEVTNFSHDTKFYSANGDEVKESYVKIYDLDDLLLEYLFENK